MRTNLVSLLLIGCCIAFAEVAMCQESPVELLNIYRDDLITARKARESRRDLLGRLEESMNSESDVAKKAQTQRTIVSLKADLSALDKRISELEAILSNSGNRELLSDAAVKNPALRQPEYVADNFYLAFSFLYAGSPLFSNDAQSDGSSRYKRLKDEGSPLAAFRITANFRYKRIFESINSQATIPTSSLKGVGAGRYPDKWTGGFLAGDSIEAEANWSINAPTNGDRIGGALGQNGASLELIWDGLGGWYAYAAEDVATGLLTPEFGISFGFSTYFNLAVDTSQLAQVSLMTGPGIGVNLVAGGIIDSEYEKNGKKIRETRGAEFSLGLWCVYFQAPNIKQRTINGEDGFWVRLRDSGAVEQKSALGLLGSVIVRFPFSRVGYAFLKANFLWAPTADIADSWFVSGGISVSVEEVFGLIQGLFSGKN